MVEISRRGFLSFALAPLAAEKCQVRFAGSLTIRHPDGTIEVKDEPRVGIAIALQIDQDPSNGQFTFLVEDVPWLNCQFIYWFRKVGDLRFSLSLPAARNQLTINLGRNNSTVDYWEGGIPQTIDDDQLIRFNGSWREWKVTEVNLNGWPLERLKYPNNLGSRSVLHYERCKAPTTVV